ncbi:LPXTG cell wall anchor domain-containing protein [uncultured Arthrobacter sp.]
MTSAPRPDDSNALLVAGIGAAVIAIIAGLIALARRKENRARP